MRADRVRSIRAAGLAAVAVGLVVAAAGGLPIGRWLAAVPAGLGRLGPWGPAAYAIGSAVAVALMVPATPLILVAGAAFGPWVGGLAATAGINLGSAASFFGARYLARDRLARRLGGDARLAAVRRALDAGGWRLVVLLRLSPLVPLGLQNVAHGLSRISYRTFAWAGGLAMLPATALYALLGDVGRAGLAAGGPLRQRTGPEWLALAVGLAATAAALAYGSRLARRALASAGAS